MNTTLSPWAAPQARRWARWPATMPTLLGGLLACLLAMAQATGSATSVLAWAVSAQALGLAFSGLWLALETAPRLSVWERRQAPTLAGLGQLLALRRMAAGLLMGGWGVVALAVATAPWPGELPALGMAKAFAAGAGWLALALAAGLASGWALQGRAPRPLSLALPVLCLALAGADWTWGWSLRLHLPLTAFITACIAHWTWLWLGDRDALTARGQALIAAEWRAVWAQAWERLRPSWRRVPFEDEVAAETPAVYALVVTPQSPTRPAGPGLLLIILLTQGPQLLGQTGLLIWQQPLESWTAGWFALWMLMAGLVASLGLVGDDLHWRRTLSPGGRAWRSFGARVLWQSGRQAVAALALLALVGLAMQPWVPAAALRLWQGLPLLAADLALALAAAAWVRGLRNTRAAAFIGAVALGALGWGLPWLATQSGWQPTRDWPLLVAELTLAALLAWHAKRLWRRHDLAALGATQRAQA